MSAKEKILDAIRSANGEGTPEKSRTEAYRELRKTFKVVAPKLSEAELPARFIEKARASDAEVFHVQMPEQITTTVRDVIEGHQLEKKLVVARDTRLKDLPWEAVGMSYDWEGGMDEETRQLFESPALDLPDPELFMQTQEKTWLEEGAARDEHKVSITWGHAGVAETGSILMQSSPEQPAGLNFLPEMHIAVVETKDIVATLEEAYARLKQPLARHVSFITGPSRTADIEQTLTRGAHGPRHFVIIVLDSPGAR